MLEGLHAVEARIAQIRADHAGSVAAPSQTTAPPASAPASADDFASTLTRAISSGSGGLTPARLTSPGGYGPMRVPDSLRRFGNGRIPTDLLAPIGTGGERLSKDAAASFLRMQSDAAAAGVRIGVSDSYRSYDEQVAVAAKKGLYSNGGLAAAPGTSDHGWGLAIDVDVDGRGEAWLRDNGWRYGFVEDTPREPWHFGYRPASVLS